MKQYRIFTVILACIMFSGIAGSIYFLREPDRSETDMVLLNDIAQTAKENFDDIDKMKEYDFGAEYIIFDPRGNAIYSSEVSGINDLSGAVKGHYPYINIIENGQITGSAALLEDMDEIYTRRRNRIFCIIALSGATMVVCMILWGAYVKRNIIKPFRKMEDFAGEIAAGNLDAPLKMEKNNMFGIFTESFDIMREELGKSREREIQLKQREKELIASLSHDLKTPVTGIKLTAELMQAQSKDPGSLEKLGNIYKKADQIDALVNDLFTSTLKDLGEMNVTVSDESSQVLHEFVVRCDDKRLVSEKEIPGCVISIDCRRMEQIIGNIIANSYKYANTSINISYKIIEGYLKMSIRDYGSGVPENELPLLTNKFYRSKEIKESKAEGSGLGLYIAKTLIEKMNGEIRCLNAEPGFEVRLLIPLS